MPPASATKEAKQILGHEGEGSQKQQQQQQLSTANISAKSASTSSALIKPPSSAGCSPIKIGDSPILSKLSDTTTGTSNLLIADQSNRNATDDRDNGELYNRALDTEKATPTPIKLSRSTATSNFVRNSLPSRSVNLGHSRSSAYLDRIRASVTATTTTNTTSSFNEQMRDIVLSQQPGSHLPESRYTLNCMLDHQHSERCFVTDRIDHLQTSQMIAANSYHHHHNLGSHLPSRSSRQLNALIDPVSHERLIVSTLQHNHGNFQQQMYNQAQEQNPFGVHDGAKLTEQQIVHLASLHHQHYYHHLQHMHQLHQLHHQHHLHLHHHRMHHKYQQQQQPHQRTPGKANDNEQQPTTHQQDLGTLGKQAARQKQCDLIYSGGSQFHAPSSKLDQVYANAAAANNDFKQSTEYQHRTKLVKSNDKSNQHGSIDLNGQSRLNRQVNAAKIGMASQQHQAHHQIGHYTLPQIDEVNGLPTVEASAVQRNGSPRKNPCSGPKLTPEAILKANQHNLSSNGSPSSSSSSSSSPTSSASSNLSPSSASSSSSINSLSTSSAPLNRSSLRHTATDCLSRRQFSVERELANVMPMTAALSRVGSCRSTTRTLPDGSQLGPDDRHDVALMQTPVKSQQPSMRTSKILNISQQSGAQLPAQQQQQQKLTSNRVSKHGIDLANIKLNQNLAFASLRAPKCSPSESGVGSSLISNNGKGQFSTAKVERPTASSSLERRKQGNNSASNDDGGNKSSVWFEYGCV